MGRIARNKESAVDTILRAPKLAERIALQIGDDIVSENPVPGTPLGTEAELLAQYGSSRCTIREAIAILERDGVVDVRRGRGGGLFVAPPDMLALSHAMLAYFEYIDVSAAEIMGARKILNPLAVRLATERLGADDIAGLRKPGLRFWALLKATHNPVLDILARSARRFEIITLLRSDVTEHEYFGMLERVYAMHARQAEAIIAGNLQLALELESEVLHKAEHFLRRMMDHPRGLTQAELLERLDLFVGRQRPLKKPERVTYAMMNEIIGLGWPVGHHLGSEPDLLDRYGIGRSVFREAVRPMEQYSVVEMRTGRQSGLKVSAPTLEKIGTESLRRFQRIDTPLLSYTETFDALGAATVAQAAGRMATTPRPQGDTIADPAQRLEDILADGGGNRILAVMLRILGMKATPANFGTEADGAVSAAIDVGDPALAYRSFLFLRGA